MSRLRRATDAASAAGADTHFHRYCSIVSSLDLSAVLAEGLDAVVELGCHGAVILLVEAPQRHVHRRYVSARDARRVLAALDGAPPDAREPLDFTVGETACGHAVRLLGQSPGSALVGIVRGEERVPTDLCDGLGAVATILDIATTNARRFAVVEEAAARDSLTGLYNWRFFHEELARAVDASRRYRHPLALAVLDVDDFKRVNTRFGQLDGDAALAEIADHLHASARATDIVGRIGGDEFAVILPHSTAEDAARLYRRVANRIAGSKRLGSIGVSVSGGIAERTAREDADRFFRRAERSLRHAKATGKSHFENA
jgi:diguanylate cyclase (GGDEF)-like protein